MATKVVKRTRSRTEVLSEGWFAYISSRLGKEWKLVMFGLGLTATDIDHIEADNPHDTIMQSTKGFILWNTRNTNMDKHSKLQDLFTALEEFDRADLAEELEKLSITPATACQKDCLDTLNMCTKHNKRIDSCCRFCRIPACVSCIEESHKMHNIVSLNVETEKTKRDLRKSVEDSTQDVRHHLVLNRRKLCATKRKYNSNTDVAKTLVHSRIEEIKAEIDTVGDKKIHELESRSKRVNDKLSQLEEILNDVDIQLQRKNEILEEISVSQNDIEILEKKGQLTDIVKNLNQTLPLFNLDSVDTPEFVASESNLEDVITTAFGHCNFVRKQKSVCENNADFVHDVIESRLETVSDFQFIENEKIRNIVPSKSGTAWVTSKPIKCVSLLHKDGKKEVHLTVDFRIDSIIEIQNGELIFTTFLGLSKPPREIFKLKSNGSISSFITTDRLIPCHLSLARTGHIFVSIVDSYSFELTVNSERTVKKFTENGLYVQEFRVDEKGEHLFNQPYTVLEHENGDLWIKNRSELVAGHVVVIGKTGKPKFRYCGVTSAKSNEAFFPGDLCSLSNSNVIISDTNNKLLHVVDSAGTLLQFLSAHVPVALRSPTCLCVDSEGFLWVGSIDGHIQILKYSK